MRICKNAIYAVRQLMIPPFKPRRKIGFDRQEVFLLFERAAGEKCVRIGRGVGESARSALKDKAEKIGKTNGIVSPEYSRTAWTPGSIRDATGQSQRSSEEKPR